MTIDSLHGLTLPEHAWWACHHPERRHQEVFTYYDDRCHRCVIAMQAAIASGCVPYITYHDPTTGDVNRIISVEEWLAQNGRDFVWRMIRAQA